MTCHRVGVLHICSVCRLRVRRACVAGKSFICSFLSGFFTRARYRRVSTSNIPSTNLIFSFHTLDVTHSAHHFHIAATLSHPVNIPFHLVLHLHMDSKSLHTAGVRFKCAHTSYVRFQRPSHTYTHTGHLDRFLCIRLVAN